MRLQRGEMILETRVVSSEVAGSATVDSLVAETRNLDLLDFRMSSCQFGALGFIASLGASLIEVSGLVPLPFVKKLIVKNDPVDYQHHQARDSQCQFHRRSTKETQTPNSDP